MAVLSAKLRSLDNDGLMFYCPGCNMTHTVYHGSGTGPKWTWNGDIDKPTFSPSVLVRVGHYIPDRTKGDCWCDYNKEHPDDQDFKCLICHSFITDGKIQFLNDCSHELAGQTVDLPDRIEMETYNEV